jgi:cytochrome c oxidase assembly protein subunit 15
VDEPVVLAPALRAALIACLALVWVQVALGGWVSTNYAVLACAGFPKCQGAWWPAMNFEQAFELWRPLGLTGTGEHIDFSALVAIHYAHRLAAYVVLAAIAALVWRLNRAAVLSRQARWLAVLAVLQFLTGLSNVVFDWPLAAAVMHTGGAAAIIGVLTWAACESRAAAPVREISAQEVSA